MSQLALQSPPVLNETEILSQIVDALISAQEDLTTARPAEWDQILRDACREQRMMAHVL